MNIYAIRDRLIDYFQTPFVAPGDKEVLAMIANTINNPTETNAIAQAPHQFEIWRLGEIAEYGHLVPNREYLADCNAYLRADPGREPAERRADEAQNPKTPSSNPAGGAGRPA